MNIVDLDILYGFSNRVAANLTVPFVWASGGAEQGTAASHRWPRQAPAFNDAAQIPVVLV